MKRSNVIQNGTVLTLLNTTVCLVAKGVQHYSCLVNSFNDNKCEATTTIHGVNIAPDALLFEIIGINSLHLRILYMLGIALQ